MKRLLINKRVKNHRMNLSFTWKVCLPLLFSFMLFSGFHGIAQCPQALVKVRFANPQFDCPTQTYCVDVEFQSDTSNQQLFGMDVRFFYDGNVLKSPMMGDFQEGYNSNIPGEIITNPPCDGASFGFTGPLEWFNGNLQLVSASPIFLNTGWTKLFNVCFHVDDPNSLSIINFCPCIVWDLQKNPPDPETGRGYFQGDDGVVISFVDHTLQQESKPTTENAIQFNWQYDNSGDSFGHPVSITCISTTCGYVIPLSNWSLFLAIGLMFVSSLFIWRRRMNS